MLLAEPPTISMAQITKVASSGSKVSLLHGLPPNPLSRRGFPAWRCGGLANSAAAVQCGAVGLDDAEGCRALLGVAAHAATGSCYAFAGITERAGCPTTLSLPTQDCCAGTRSPYRSPSPTPRGRRLHDHNDTTQRKVRNSVRAGPPTCTVDRTVFELWLGGL